MDLKTSLSVALLSFFSATIVVLIARSLDNQAIRSIEPQLTRIADQLEALNSAGALTAGPIAPAKAVETKNGVAVNYFFSNTRCTTCRAIESQTLFAMSFCPTSAAWFFGLLALTLGSDSGAITSVLTRIGLSLPDGTVPGGSLVLPFVYGVGTGLPVILVAFLLAFSANAVGATYKVLGKIEWWARMTTGVIFISLGVYFSLVYVYA